MGPDIRVGIKVLLIFECEIRLDTFVIQHKPSEQSVV